MRRSLLVITLVVLCHLVEAPWLVTSQLLFAQEQAQPAATAPDQEGQLVTIRAREQEKAGDVYTLRGEVEIEYQGYVLRADNITYNAATGEVVAEGRVTLEGGNNGENISAGRAEYNVKTESGKFYDVVGSSGIKFRGRDVTLLTNDPFLFAGKMVERQGRTRYIVHDGSVTSCQMPNPKWTFNAGMIVVDVGSTARVYNATFRIRKLPIFYFPAAAYPIDSFKRQSGFLVPTFGRSSRRGTILGQSVYWAMSRSMDLTVGAEYWSKRGWAQNAEFRARPSQTSTVNVSYFGVIDRGIRAGSVDQGGQNVTLNAEGMLWNDWRGVASLEYLNSFVFRLAFTETLNEAVNSEVKSVAFLSKNFDGIGVNLLAKRYQNFQSTLRGDAITTLQVPSLQVGTTLKEIGRSRIYWSVDGGVDAISRRELGFRTNDLVGRFDLTPRLAAPLHWRGWSVTPELAMRETYYTEQLGFSINGTTVADPINRRAIEAAVEILPPALSKTFAQPLWGRTLRHMVQPRIQYRIVHGVDNFDRIIRFDYRDTLSDTHEVEYALVNRFFLRRRDQRPACSEEELMKATNCPTGPSEFLTWEIAQKYFIDDDFGGAVVAGRRNVFTTTAAFTGISFITEPRRFSPIVSRLRLRSSDKTDLQWQADFDPKEGRLNASTIFATYYAGEYNFGLSYAFLQAPGDIFSPNNPVVGPRRFNQLRMLAGYGDPTKPGFGANVNIGADVNLNFLQYGALQTRYNWDCCGVTVEYRRFALGPVRNENQFRFGFSLANVGTFGNIRKKERLF